MVLIHIHSHYQFPQFLSILLPFPMEDKLKLPYLSFSLFLLLLPSFSSFWLSLSHSLSHTHKTFLSFSFSFRYHDLKYYYLKCTVHLTSHPLSIQLLYMIISNYFCHLGDSSVITALSRSYFYFLWSLLLYNFFILLMTVIVLSVPLTEFPLILLIFLIP